MTEKRTEAAGPSGSALSDELGAGADARCMCNDRALSACPGEFEPGCDLGSNAAHVRVTIDANPRAVDLGGGSLAQVRDPHRGGDSYEASMLRNLLARVHRDGGHYLEEHGLDKALEDADAKVVAWLTVEERLADALFVLGMVDKNNRIDAGEKGKAWSGRFVVDEVRRVLDHPEMQARLRQGYIAALRPVECSHTGMSYGDDKAGGPSGYTKGWGDCLKAVKAALGLGA
jgi:hypothetical protein